MHEFCIWYEIRLVKGELQAQISFHASTKLRSRSTIILFMLKDDDAILFPAFLIFSSCTFVNRFISPVIAIGCAYYPSPLLSPSNTLSSHVPGHPSQNLCLARDQSPVEHGITMSSSNERIRGQISADSQLKTTHLRSKNTHVSRNGSTSAAPGVFRQSRIKSIAMPNMPIKCTPASSILRFASAARFPVKVPDASVLAPK